MSSFGIMHCFVAATSKQHASKEVFGRHNSKQRSTCRSVKTLGKLSAEYDSLTGLSSVARRHG